MRDILQRHFRLLAALSLIALGTAAFGRTLRLGFIWDDHQMIESNPYIKGWSVKNLEHCFKSDPFNQGLNYYRPLQSVSNAVDFSL